MKILAIDPGNIESAYCLIDSETYIPLKFGKIENDILLDIIKYNDSYDEIAIEMIASYGMPVGQTVFETCVWIGRFIAMSSFWIYIYRKDVKMNLCGTMRAKDSNVRQALIDRFGIVGVKKQQGWFYGFKSDIWSAYATGVTHIDKLKQLVK